MTKTWLVPTMMVLALTVGGCGPGLPRAPALESQPEVEAPLGDTVTPPSTDEAAPEAGPGGLGEVIWDPAAPSELAPIPQPSAGLIGDWYVDAKHDGSGTSSSPFRTISQAVKAASAGQTIVVRDGTYRESVNIEKSLTLLGEPGATIKGSDVWSGWKHESPYFTKSLSFALPALTGICKGGSNGRCRSAAQVFINGIPQREEMSLSAVGAGGFWVGNGKIHLGSDPGGKTVEVSTRDYWVGDRSFRAVRDVTIRGFTMMHAASAAQKGGITTANGRGWVIENNDLSYAHGYNVRVQGGGHVVRGNKIRYAGNTGIGGGPFNNVRVEDNEIAYNNTEEFEWDWEGGGLKFCCSSDVVIRGNLVQYNDGAGLWCDTDCNRIQFLGNRVRHNLRVGISYEISRNCLIADNVTWENGRGKPIWVWGAGILLQNSSSCTVRNNTVAWNAGGISVIEQPRGPRYWVHSTRVHDNVIITRNATQQLSWISDTSRGRIFAGFNSGWSNRYYWDPSGTRAWGWKGTKIDLESFNATPGEENGTAITKSQADALLGAVFVPLLPSR